uniref:ubiquitinyl hydrolase 1 n=1 Tax=Anolis carolinensis TaxID=28377 RepID=H9GUS8_ANOCA
MMFQLKLQERKKERNRFESEVVSEERIKLARPETRETYPTVRATAEARSEDDRTTVSSRPDVGKQQAELTPLVKMPLCPGDSWCLIDFQWFMKWKKYVGFECWDLYYAGKPNLHPGPIDNSRHFADSETQTLKKYRINKVDYEFVPTAAWNKLVNWYGCIKGQRPTERKVVKYGEYLKYCKVEVYPLELKLCQNNDSTDLVSSHFNQAEGSAGDGGIINLQEKLSESQLKIHYKAEANETPIAEIPIQYRNDTGVGQAAVMEDLEVSVISENDLLEHCKEMNVVTRSQKLEEDRGSSAKEMPSSVVPCFPENKTVSYINFCSQRCTRSYFQGMSYFSMKKNSHLLLNKK